MPRFLDTTGLSDIAIAVCDRCKMKRALSCETHTKRWAKRDAMRISQRCRRVIGGRRP